LQENVTPRIAYCTDTYDEANGVATLSRAFASFARRRQLPVLFIRPGETTRSLTEGTVTTVEVARSVLRLPLSAGLSFDLLIHRRAAWLREQMMAFSPDIVHITGPGDIGMVCARLSHVLRVPKPPLVAAWHTNLHQYAKLRLGPLLRLLPDKAATAVGDLVEALAFRLTARFYQSARLILAPNAEILGQLTAATGKSGRLMLHGVDSELFTPRLAPFDAQREPITLGHVGRLVDEKNVRELVEVADRLPAAMRERVRFLIVGDGPLRDWLAQRMPPNTCFTGILRGQELAAAFASMDVFFFPSLTDTFGLVMLEAMAAGVPVVSYGSSGPLSVVQPGVNGLVASTPAEFAEAVSRLVKEPELRYRLGRAARETAVAENWDAVFCGLYESYRTLVPLR